MTTCPAPSPRPRLSSLFRWLLAGGLALTCAAGVPSGAAHADTAPHVTVSWDSGCTAFTATTSGYAPSDTITIRWHHSDGKTTGTRTLQGNDVVAQKGLHPGQAALVSYEAWSDKGNPITEFTVTEATCPAPSVAAKWVRNCRGITLTMHDWPAGYRTNVVWYNRQGLEMGRTTGGKAWGKYDFGSQAVSHVDYFVYGPQGEAVTDTRSSIPTCDRPPGSPWTPSTDVEDHFR